MLDLNLMPKDKKKTFFEKIKDKKLAVILSTFLAVNTAAPVFAGDEEKTVFYDEKGQVTGFVVDYKDGNKVYYDENGKEKGWAFSYPEEDRWIVQPDPQKKKESKNKIRVLNNKLYIDSLVEDIKYDDIDIYSDKQYKVVANPKELETFVEMLCIYGKNFSNSPKGICFLEYADKLKRNDVKVNRLLGETYFKNENYEKAVKCLEFAYKNGKKDNETKKLLAESYHQMGNRLKENEALPIYYKWLKLEPNNPIAYNNIGSCFAEMGNYVEARKYFEKALLIDPDFDVAKKNLEIIKDK